MITKIYKIVCTCLVCCGIAATTTSCEDFFDQESDHVLYSDHDHLDNAVDTIYSVTGILNKLQAIADRTIILGEVRGDLVDLTSDAASDLRDVANFNVGDNNMYNVPRDYYAVINNCNYFIANVDTALRNNRNQNIFMREYAAVKAIRAWTYLQLVLNYGQVPFVTEPIMTKDEAEQDYAKADLQSVCQYFLNDLADIPEAYNTEYPGYRTIRNQDSRFFWFPLNIIRAELNLWAGNYREAALHYYKYISERNGMNSTYPNGETFLMWNPGSTTWQSFYPYNRLGSAYLASESYTANSELITMIPGDSIRAEGNYSELRNLFNSRDENNYKVSIFPSTGMEEISAAQVNCCLTANGNSVVYAPQGLSNHRSGDLRLSLMWYQGNTVDPITNDRIETQSIYKYQTRNVHIYRRQMIYLRMAEALNLAGYPRAAFAILSEGLTNRTMALDVMPYYSQSDSAYLAQFDFPTSRYGVVTVEDIITRQFANTHNTIGIHTRGSGWTPMNEYYQLPEDSILSPELTARQQAFVDSLLLNENALELCFEGTRFYDLMRFALRSSNPGQFMKDHVYARRGKNGRASVQADIKADLSDPRNWYLRWNGKIGF